MQRLTTTPFGRRTQSAGQMAQLWAVPTEMDQTTAGDVDKWHVLRDLTTARAAFGLGSRTLTVLSALLSFHPEKRLSGEGALIVFPSNRALSERAHGMAEATLRRHLAALVGSGLLVRHDSPNGKRYAARDGSGALTVAFGFDLRPLLVRAAEIAQAARAVEEATAALRRLREAVVLLLRDVSNLESLADELSIVGPCVARQERLAETRRMLRRKPDRDALRRSQTWLLKEKAALETVMNVEVRTEELSGNPAETERHYQNSKPETLDKEPCKEEIESDGDRAGLKTSSEAAPEQQPMPLAVVLKACPTLATYADVPIQSWNTFHKTVDIVAPWLGISRDAWDVAQRQMGPISAAITVAAMLERKDTIRAPGGYLRALSEKAGKDRFRPGPMIMALLRGDTAARC